MVTVLAVCAPARAAVAWHHSRSPYRAVFTIKETGNHPDAGFMLTVPSCGLAAEGGDDLYAYDERGHSLYLDSLGPTTGNSVLAAVAPPQRGRRLYVYFGSGMPSRKSPGVFRHGLRVEIRSLPDGSMRSADSAERLLRNSVLRGVVPVRQIVLAANPLSSMRNIILRFRGHLRVPERKSMALFLSQNGAGYLWVDERLVIERSGNHSANDNRHGDDRSTVELRPPLAPLDCLVLNRERPITVVLAQYRDERNKHPVPPDAFVHAGTATLDAVEARRADRPCPVFGYDPISYLGYEADQYTEMRFHTLNGEPARWEFADGCSLEGEQISRIIPGLNPMRLRVVQGRVHAEGMVQFRQSPPARRRIHNGRHFQHYRRLIMQCPPGELDTQTLAAYWRFLRHRERNADLEPVCDALIAREAVRPEEREQIALDFARNAPERPNAVLNAYHLLLAEADDQDERIRYAREFAEFAIVRQRDPKLADELIGRIEKARPEAIAVPGVLRLQMALHGADMEEARAVLERFGSFVLQDRDPRTVTVRANALAARFEKVLSEGYFQEAREALWSWEVQSPSDWENGRLALARAQLWRTLDWLEGAARELQAARQLDPLLPRLPDVELQLANILAAQGKTDEAKALWKSIVENYPNHAVATAARQKLEGR